MHCKAENSNKQAQIQPMLANRLVSRQHMLYRRSQDPFSKEKAPERDKAAHYLGLQMIASNHLRPFLPLEPAASPVPAKEAAGRL